MLSAIFVALAIVAPSVFFSRLWTNAAEQVALDAAQAKIMTDGADDEHP
jgi:hypothetical protein